MLRRTPWGDAGENRPGISFRLRNRVRKHYSSSVVSLGSAPFEGRGAHNRLTEGACDKITLFKVKSPTGFGWWIREGWTWCIAFWRVLSALTTNTEWFKKWRGLQIGIIQRLAGLQASPALADTIFNIFSTVARDLNSFLDLSRSVLWHWHQRPVSIGLFLLASWQ